MLTNFCELLRCSVTYDLFFDIQNARVFIVLITTAIHLKSDLTRGMAFDGSDI